MCVCEREKREIERDEVNEIGRGSYDIFMKERERESEEKKLLNFFDKFALIYTAVSPLYFLSKGKKAEWGEVKENEK